MTSKKTNTGKSKEFHWTAIKAFQNPKKYIRELGFVPTKNASKKMEWLDSRIKWIFIKNRRSKYLVVLIVCILGGFIPYFSHRVVNCEIAPKNIRDFFFPQDTFTFTKSWAEPKWSMRTPIPVTTHPSLWDPNAAAWAGIVVGLVMSALATRAAQRSELFRVSFERRRALNEDLVREKTKLMPLVSGATIITSGQHISGNSTPEQTRDEDEFVRIMYVFSELDTLEFMYENYRDGLLSEGKHFVRACLIFQSRCESSKFRDYVEGCLVNGRYSRQEFINGVKSILENFKSAPAGNGFPVNHA
ncbi:hypothetical protein M2447_001864 [Ereboglobus sp. PH5-10]|uniref:hypothetical protein n=1 Tax=Ereboglobus sp. PH5-10 TaxID=2940629 RepID=UPI0024072EB8|nr:hypothetical protein [Ereboglobus sp. PH5-10]MDF9827762.1 hypothetical protein [Ereboglobus sp. PH5-10]